MQNEEGQNMDLYIPRKCSATNRLITSKDHASVQINIGHLDADGVYTGQFTTFALCGFIRAQVCITVSKIQSNLTMHPPDVHIGCFALPFLKYIQIYNASFECSYYLFCITVSKMHSDLQCILCMLILVILQKYSQVSNPSFVCSY